MDEAFGRYRLRELVGEGGMGQVFRAYDTATDRYVALKVLPRHLSADPDYQARFRREAHAAARLSEPHIVPIHDYGDIDGRLFLDMRLIDGTELGLVLRRGGPLSAGRAAAVVEQVAAALDAAHAAGLVHRDVKPSNILLADRDFAYLIDFGIARAADDTGLTRTGMMIGTLAYMAPERFGGATSDRRADVYALACVLYECLTGSRPFPGNSAEEQLSAHLTAPPPRPGDWRADLRVFDGVIARGMAKDPDQRYATAGELAVAARTAAVGHSRGGEVAQTTPAQLSDLPRSTLPAGPVASRPVTADPNRDGATMPAPVSQTIVQTTADVGAPAVPGVSPIESTTGIKALAAIVAVACAVGVALLFVKPGSDSASPKPRITATVSLPAPGAGVAVDSAGHTAYVTSSVANTANGTLSILDTGTHQITASLPIKDRVGGVAVDPGIHSAFVAGDKAVSVIDTTNRTVTATIPIADSSQSAIVSNPVDHVVYLIGGGEVTVIDGAARTVAGKIALPDNEPDRQAAIDPTTHRLYVTGDQDVTVIETQKRAVITTIPVDPQGHTLAVAVDPASQTLYVTTMNDDTSGSDDRPLSIIDLGTRAVTATVPVPGNALWMTIDPADHTAYVQNYNDVMAVDTRTRSVATVDAVYTDMHSVNAIVADTTDHTVYLVTTEPGRNENTVTIIGH